MFGSKSLISSNGVVTAAAVSLLVILVGYLIRFRGWTFLIAGYDASIDIDDDLVADIVGSMLLRVGLASLVFAGLLSLGPISDIVGVIFAIAVLLAVARTIYRVKRTASG